MTRPSPRKNDLPVINVTKENSDENDEDIHENIFGIKNVKK